MTTEVMETSVRQQDLAAHLNLAQSTISRALRGQQGVSRRQRQRVVLVARELGYDLPEEITFGDPAGGIRHGVICVDIPHADPWHERLIAGAIEAAKAVGIEVVVSPHSLGELPQIVVRKQVDGLIRLMSQSDFSRGGVIPVAPVPTVSVLYPVPGADVVSVDPFGSSRALALHVAERVHPAIAAYVGLRETIGRARYHGFLCGLEEWGGKLPPELVRMCLSLDAGQSVALVGELLDLRAAGRPEHQFTLIAFYNDWLARHAVACIRTRGLRVPEDIGVVGYDDVEMPIEPDLKLTTVHLPLEELGAAAVRRLHWRLEHPDARLLHWLLETRVVDGNSVIGR